MKSHERSMMTPLELAVWGAAYMAGMEKRQKRVPEPPDLAQALTQAALRYADQVIDELRAGFVAEREREALADAKAKHRTRVFQVNGVDTLRCSCGFQPRATESADVEELMSLHLGMMQALGPEDIKEP